jgi:hypothetical protein
MKRRHPISSAPSAPDPYATAAAQGAANKDSAAFNTQLNRVDTYTPYGNSVYTNNGTAQNPSYRQDITLTPQAQEQITNQQKQDNTLSNLGFSLADQYKQNLSQPVNDQAATAKGAQDAYYRKQTAYLDPQFANQRADLNSTLSNKGVMEGSEAYNRAQGEQSRNQTFAYGQAQDQAIATGQDQQGKALAIAQQLRQQPLNELNAVRTGSQVTNPTFGSTYTGGNAQAGDIQGGVYNAYNAQVQAANSFNSGLFGVGTAAAGTIKWSDQNLKTDITRLGETPGGLPIYAYRYLWDKVRRVGVMAQDVLKVTPHAVIKKDGYYAVNYAAIA